MKFNFVNPRFIVITIMSCAGLIHLLGASPTFEWTTDHMQVGVRWQPSASRPLNNTYELTRPILAEHSSYVMFGGMAKSSQVQTIVIIRKIHQVG